ncbi:MAG: hypothetical protein HY332_17825 [Chloroflexi bacterium]|nr:hypothetical protein [Chloroflexota bacterium]
MMPALPRPRRSTIDEQRSALLDQLTGASAPHEIVAVKQAVVEWVRRHPDDVAVLSAALAIRPAAVAHSA